MQTPTAFIVPRRHVYKQGDRVQVLIYWAGGVFPSWHWHDGYSFERYERDNRCIVLAHRGHLFGVPGQDPEVRYHLDDVRPDTPENHAP